MRITTLFGRHSLASAGLGVMLASLVISAVTAVSPATASADECADGMTMDATGQCTLGLVNAATGSGGPNEATPGPAAMNACGIASADADANSIGAQTADMPCP